MPEKLVELALFAKPVDFNQEILPQCPLFTFISDGFLINSNMNILSPDAIIPRLSPLSLYIWSNFVSEGEKPSPLKLAVALCLDVPLAQDKTADSEHTFKLLHARWEVVQRILNAKAWPSWLQQALNAMSALNEKAAGDEQKQMVESHSKSIKNVLQEKPQHSFHNSSGLSRNDIRLLVNMDLNNAVNGDDLLKFVWMPPKENQAAFDMVLFFQTSTTLFTLLVDLKNFDFDSTNLSGAQVSTRKQFLKSFRKLFPKIKIEDENILCGIISVKDISTDIALSLQTYYIKSEGERVNFNLDFVVSSNEMKAVYGPTLEPFIWLFGTRPGISE